MSEHDPVVRHAPKREQVDYIVPERLREARKYRGIERKDAAFILGLTEQEYGLYENGHKPIPKEMAFGLMMLFKFPSRFFYQIKWERV